MGPINQADNAIGEFMAALVKKKPVETKELCDGIRTLVDLFRLLKDKLHVEDANASFKIFNQNSVLQIKAGHISLSLAKPEEANRSH